MYVVVIGQWDT